MACPLLPVPCEVAIETRFPLAAFGIDRAGFAQALRLAFAAWLAFTIAMLAGIPHAYWAAMPIWVVVQPSRGLLIERAIFRLIGTIIGAAAGLAALRLIHDPVVVIVALGLWVGGAAALVHVVRGVQSYGVMLAGMTAGIVILPTVLSPDGSFELALARVACTLIGVVVVTLVMAVSTPWASRNDYDEGLGALAAETVRLAELRLAGGNGEGEDALIRRLASALAAATTFTAGSVEGYRRYNGIIARIVAALSVLARAGALADRARRGAAGNTLPRDSADRLAASPAPADLATIAAADAEFGAALQRLNDGPAASGTDDVRLEPRRFSLARAVLSPQRDGAVARESGLVAGLATTAAALLGLVVPWEAGELAALGVCIFSMVMTSLPAPRRAAPQMLAGVSAGVVVAIVYRFGLQPHVETVPVLILSLAPFLLLGGLARVSKRTAIPAIDANMCFLLASQPVLGIAFSPLAILSGSAALLLGAAIVAGLIIVLPNRLALAGQRARGAIRRDLARLAEASIRAPGTTLQWPLGRLSLRLIRAAEHADLPEGSLVATRRLGDALAALRLHEAATGTDKAAITRALAALSLTADGRHAAETLEALATGTADAEAALLMRDAAAALGAGATISAGFALPG